MFFVYFCVFFMLRFFDFKNLIDIIFIISSIIHLNVSTKIKRNFKEKEILKIDWFREADSPEALPMGK